MERTGLSLLRHRVVSCPYSNLLCSSFLSAGRWHCWSPARASAISLLSDSRRTSPCVQTQTIPKHLHHSTSFFSFFFFLLSLSSLFGVWLSPSCEKFVCSVTKKSSRLSEVPPPLHFCATTSPPLETTAVRRWTLSRVVHTSELAHALRSDCYFLPSEGTGTLGQLPKKTSRTLTFLGGI